MLGLERVKVLQTNSYVYEFVFTTSDDEHTYRGIDDKYQYPFKSLAMELHNLIDNQLYSNKLFNQWKIKLFKDISTNKQNLIKSTTQFYMLTLTNDLKGNVIFDISDVHKHKQLYFRTVKLADFALFIHNLINFNEQPAMYNYYSIDKYFD